jgi:hypothetical protein
MRFEGARAAGPQRTQLVRVLFSVDYPYESVGELAPSAPIMSSVGGHLAAAAR